MNSKFLLVVLSFAGFSSCTTAYKTGQTPDDVYYSPARYANDHSRSDSNENKTVYNNSLDGYEIQTGVHNRRWRRYHDYDYGYTPYDAYYPGYISPKSVQTIKYTAPRKVNTAAYNKTSTQNVKLSKTSSNSKGTGVGNFLREILSGNNNSSSGNSSDVFNGKSGSGSSSNSSAGNSSAGKSSSTAPVRTFGKK